MRSIRPLLVIAALTLTAYLAPLRSAARQQDTHKPAAAAQDGITTEEDVLYGEVRGQKLLLDIYRLDVNRPTETKGYRPAVLYIHGGGWSGGDKHAYKGLARLLAKAGYVCFWANYRLVTKDGNKYPAQIDDAQRAVRWIRANGAKYFVDPKRIGAIGDSAGGHLVALLGTRETRNNSDARLSSYSSKVTCVVDLYGPSDFTQGANLVSPLAASIVINFMGKKPEEAPDLYKDASPVSWVSSSDAPFLIFHGTEDTLVPMDQSQRLYDALKKAGVEADLVKMENDGHGFQKKENQDRFVRETLAFFNRRLMKQP